MIQFRLIFTAALLLCVASANAHDQGLCEKDLLASLVAEIQKISTEIITPQGAPAILEQEFRSEGAALQTQQSYVLTTLNKKLSARLHTSRSLHIEFHQRGPGGMWPIAHGTLTLPESIPGIITDYEIAPRNGRISVRTSEGATHHFDPIRGQGMEFRPVPAR